MATNISHQTNEALSRVKAQFESWRRGGRQGRCIPEELWKAASELYPGMNIGKISKALKLSHSALSRHIGLQPQRREVSKQFVELAPELLMGAPNAEVCENTGVKIEVVDTRGNRLTVAYTRASELDLPGLLSAFRKSR